MGMDDQVANQKGKSDAASPFQFSLRCVFEVVFWICAFLGSVAILVRSFNATHGDNWQAGLREKRSLIPDAIAFVLLIVAPCMLFGAIPNKRIAGAMVALLLG